MTELLTAILLLALLGVWFLRRKEDAFSEQERKLISFLRRKAKRYNVEKKDVEVFLQEHFDSFRDEFIIMQKGQLILNNIPAIFKEVHRTYDKLQKY